MKKEDITQKDLFYVLDIFDSLDMQYWLDGGWGVDVLTGRQNREHRDIDIDYDSTFTEPLIKKLTDLGYEIVVDWMPARLELWHPKRGYIDIHPLILNSDGSAKQADLEDGFYQFKADWFTTADFNGRKIPCISVEAQKIFHSGYDLSEKDRIDLNNLESIL